MFTMKLKSEILYEFLRAILFPILLLSFIAVFVFQFSFKNFVDNEELNRRNKIEQLTKNLFIDHQQGLSKKRIDQYMWYLSELDLDVIFYDNNEKELYSFSEGFELAKKTSLYNTIVKDVYDKNNKKIGQIKYIYRVNNNFKKRSEVFITNLFRFIILSLFLSYFTGLIISIYLSRKITNPIEELTQATVNIRKQIYAVPDIKSRIVEVNQLSQNINYMANSLKSQEFNRKQYAQNISHELRTPLTNIRVNLELMQDGIMETNEENVNMLLVEIDRLTSLINQLNNTFKKSTPETIYNPSKFNLSDFLNEIYKSMKTQYDNSGVLFDLEISENLDIITDREKLANIIINLLSNALKACKKGDSVLLRARHINKKIVISVKDTGIGISEENKPKIFERFFRVDDCRNTKTNGYGLGLSIVKNYTDIIGANISVNSKLNLGTVMLVSFDDNIISK